MTNENAEPDASNAEPTPPEDSSVESAPPSRMAMVIASVFMTAPAAIPFYYALQQEDTTLKWIFIGAGFSLVIFNAIALVLIYRWLQRMVK